MVTGGTPSLVEQSKRKPQCHIPKNAEANDKAYDPTQITIQALDALAADCVAFEATTANVTSEHEAGDAIHAAAAETAGELERIQKDQGRL